MLIFLCLLMQRSALVEAKQVDYRHHARGKREMLSVAVERHDAAEADTIRTRNVSELKLAVLSYHCASLCGYPGPDCTFKPRANRRELVSMLFLIGHVCETTLYVVNGSQVRRSTRNLSRKRFIRACAASYGPSPTTVAIARSGNKGRAGANAIPASQPQQNAPGHLLFTALDLATGKVAAKCYSHHHR